MDFGVSLTFYYYIINNTPLYSSYKSNIQRYMKKKMKKEEVVFLSILFENQKPQRVDLVVPKVSCYS